MKNTIQIFNNSEFGTVRTICIDGECWFVGKDVAIALGYSNPQKALRDHVNDEDKTVNDLFTVNGTKGILINESGLYSLILSSKLPNAKRFKHWVTSEILPSINKAGKYEVKQNEQKCIEDKSYKYADKYYKGQLVLILKDLEYFTGIKSSTFSYYIRAYSAGFVEGEDFYCLKGCELREFKSKNGGAEKQAKVLTLITKSGFDKLCGLINGIPEIECFSTDSDADTDEPINPNFKADKGAKLLIKSAREDLEALKVLLNGFDSYNPVNIYKIYQDAMLEVERSLYQKIYAISKFDVHDEDVKVLSFRKQDKEWQKKRIKEFKTVKYERYSPEEILNAHIKYKGTHLHYLF